MATTEDDLRFIQFVYEHMGDETGAGSRLPELFDLCPSEHDATAP
jgi:hypothetical protein